MNLDNNSAMINVFGFASGQKVKRNCSAQLECPSSKSSLKQNTPAESNSDSPIFFTDRSRFASSRSLAARIARFYSIRFNDQVRVSPSNNNVTYSMVRLKLEVLEKFFYYKDTIGLFI